MRLKQRQEFYNTVSGILAGYSEQQLLHALDTAIPHHKGIGGTSHILTIDNLPIFVKKLPLTDLERFSENPRSTANLFKLPMFYHYGIGSAGFSAWRELSAHEMTTRWVLEQQCTSFPLLYHWRVIAVEAEAAPLNEEARARIEKDVAYWEGSDEIRKRLEVLHTASAYVYLFLEFIPSNLGEWLESKLQKQETNAITFVESKLLTACEFLRSHNFVHFDAHFQNILTDGEDVYLSDFGLCLSSDFILEENEKEFLQQHLMYDRASVSVNLLHCIITSHFGKANWIPHLRDCLTGEYRLDPHVRDLIQKHAEVALAMDEFYTKLQKGSKKTPFPITVI